MGHRSFPSVLILLLLTTKLKLARRGYESYVPARLKIICKVLQVKKITGKSELKKNDSIVRDEDLCCTFIDVFVPFGDISMYLLSNGYWTEQKAKGNLLYVEIKLYFFKQSTEFLDLLSCRVCVCRVCVLIGVIFPHVLSRRWVLDRTGSEKMSERRHRHQ